MLTVDGANKLGGQCKNIIINSRESYFKSHGRSRFLLTSTWYSSVEKKTFYMLYTVIPVPFNLERFEGLYQIF